MSLGLNVGHGAFIVIRELITWREGVLVFEDQVGGFGYVSFHTRVQTKRGKGTTDSGIYAYICISL